MFTKKAGDPEHVHQMEVDGEGTGETISTSVGVPHTHKIDNWTVEEKDGHTHAVSSDYVKGTEVYGNGDEAVIIERGESVSKKIEVEVKVCTGE